MSTFISRVLASLLIAFALVACAAEPAEPSEPEDVPLFTQAELDQMLAPVALYPDELLSQILMAATYPLEVVEAARFSRANPDLKGQDAVRAAQDKPWDPSVKAMLAFPQILDRMDQDLDWTRRLGDAFLAQQEQVMDTVQALRKRADEAGNLQETEHVQVVREERTIIVRNRYPDVVYVPYYDPLLIYGSWWWPDYEPVRWSPWTGYRYYSGYNGYFWGPSIVVGYGFFYGHYDWHDHYIRVVEAPPFYYRRPPPPRYRWEHDRRHRKGVPYRHQRVYERYHDDRDPVPGRPPRERHDDRQDHHADGQPPAAGPREGGERPPREGGQAPHEGGQAPHDGEAPPEVINSGQQPPPAPPSGDGPRGERPDRDTRVNTGVSTPVMQTPAVGTESRAPRGQPEVDAGSMPVTPTVPRNRDPDGRDGRNQQSGAAEPTAPRQETPRYAPPTYSPPPQRETPTYSAPPRQQQPSYTPAPQRETPSYSAPQRQTPSYSPPPQREAPTYSAPPRQQQPSYTPAPKRETPSYSAPQRQTPSYSPPPQREAPTYSAPPRQQQPSYTPAPQREAPSYSAPQRQAPTYSPPPQREAPSYSAPRQERPSYTPPPQRETPSHSAPPRSESSSSQRSGQGNESRNRERPD